jgi:predicted permease
MTAWIQDARFALRTLARAPLFTATAAASLAVGIGAHAAVYSLVDALFLRGPAGVPQPERLVNVNARHLVDGAPRERGPRYGDYLQYREHNRTFAALAAQRHQWLVDTEKGDEVSGRAVSPGYFDVLGLAPQRGRFFAPGDVRAVVLSDAFWQERFARNPACVGRALKLNDVLYTIVGVTPPGFRGFATRGADELWVHAEHASDAWLESAAIGRLLPGHTLEDAERDLGTLARRLEESQPDRARPRLGVALSPLVGGLPWTARGAWIRSTAMQMPWTLAAMATGLLLVAGTNVSGMLLASGLTRQKELAVRAALGAPRGRIVRQLLMEGLLLSIAAGAGGLVLARAITQRLASYYNMEVEGGRAEYVLHLNTSVVLYGLGVALLTGLGCALLPAWRSSRTTIAAVTKDDAATTSGRPSRLRAGLLVAQLALSVVLLFGAGLMLRSMATLLLNPGFDPRGVAFIRMKPHLNGYDRGRQQTYFSEVRRRVENTAGVRAVSYVEFPPLEDWGGRIEVSLPGGGGPAATSVLINSVSDGFFETLRIPIERGRAFEPADAGRRIVVVNEELARRLWPGQDAVGRALVAGGEWKGETYEVVGVARYAPFERPGREADARLFRPGGGNRMLVRVDGDVRAALPWLLAQARAVDPAVAVTEGLPLTDVVRNFNASAVLVTGVLHYSAAVALLLTAVGMYGVMAMSVSRRTREIGIRMALGAAAAGVVRMVLGDAMRLAALGAAIGVGLALASSRALSHYLYGVTPTDPAALMLALGSIGAVVLIACLVPARRAARIDPVRALRCE